MADRTALFICQFGITRSLEGANTLTELVTEHTQRNGDNFSIIPARLYDGSFNWVFNLLTRARPVTREDLDYAHRVFVVQSEMLDTILGRFYLDDPQGAHSLQEKTYRLNIPNGFYLDRRILRRMLRSQLTPHIPSFVLGQ